MGRRINIKQRDEDFMKMDSLHYLADQHGLGILGFLPDEGGWKTNYLDRRKYTQHEPKREQCRDDIDFDLKVSQAIRLCLVHSKVYPKFQDMVLGEIERLKQIPL